MRENVQLEVASEEDAFKVSVYGIIQQGKRCYNHVDMLCAYKLDKEPNVHCAVGWLLTEAELANDSTLYGSVGTYFANNPDVAERLAKQGVSEEFLSRLQVLHDAAHLGLSPTSTWDREVFRCLAVGFAMAQGFEYEWIQHRYAPRVNDVCVG